MDGKPFKFNYTILKSGRIRVKYKNNTYYCRQIDCACRTKAEISEDGKSFRTSGWASVETKLRHSVRYPPSVIVDKDNDYESIFLGI